MLINDSSTTSKRSIWPEETRHLWVVGCGGSILELSDGNFYDDWASALGANTLGYRWRPEIAFLPAASLPWRIEHDFAEEFCAAMGTEAVRFFKSGSDALSCAVRLARAYTGRSYIVTFRQCYHGTGDTFGPIIWSPEGYTKQDVIVGDFGQDLPHGWQRAAAIVVEPVPKAIDLPPDGWLQHLREVCDEHGIVLIADEVILGYRHSLRGYLDAAGVRAELRCYGKAMGQGAAISAVSGDLAIMRLLADQVHFSGTNNGEPLALYIAQATLQEYQRLDVCATLGIRGNELRFRLEHAGFHTRGLNSRFEVELEDKASAVLYCFEHGILFPGFCSMALTHTEEQMTKLVNTLKEWRDGR